MAVRAAIRAHQKRDTSRKSRIDADDGLVPMRKVGARLVVAGATDQATKSSSRGVAEIARGV
jgi:hypothetical protein